jgi:3-oxoacyl-[acyl-carrier-protein] synthase-3
MSNLISKPGSLYDIEYELPINILKNKYFDQKFPEWNVRLAEVRTGVFERHIAEDTETAYDLALAAANRLLLRNPDLHNKIDGILFCTQTPDYIMPSNAFLLQRDLGLKSDIIAFDYNLACSGFVYGLVMATSFIRSGVATNILLVTADTYSKHLGENDRSTRMLFGDGAAVTWIGISDGAMKEPLISNFCDVKLSSDGGGWSDFYIKSGGARYPSLSEDFNNKIQMNGLRVLNYVNGRVVEQIRSLLASVSLSVDDIDHFLFHQASGLALNGLQKRLKIPPKKMFSNIEKIGNTVSSSLPILISDFFKTNSVSKGSVVLMSGFGVGFSWGSILSVV